MCVCIVVTANLRADPDHVLCVSELGFGEWHQRERETNRRQDRRRVIVWELTIVSLLSEYVVTSI